MSETMPAAVSDAELLAPRDGGGWQLQAWAGPSIAAGLTDRLTDRDAFVSALRARHIVEAEQVHGGSVAIVEGLPEGAGPVAGCDALVTERPGSALLIRTADCLPVFFAAPRRRAAGLAHAGWRGLAAGVLERTISVFGHRFHTAPDELRVAIGPAIRPCCYEVGEEFERRFGAFVQQQGGRRTCDLIGVARERLQRAGVRAASINDSGRCTACETDRWYSLRREGQQTGRMTSFILLR